MYLSYFICYLLKGISLWFKLNSLAQFLTKLWLKPKSFCDISNAIDAFSTLSSSLPAFFWSFAYKNRLVDNAIGAYNYVIAWAADCQNISWCSIAIPNSPNKESANASSLCASMNVSCEEGMSCFLFHVGSFLSLKHNSVNLSRCLQFRLNNCFSVCHW